MTVRELIRKLEALPPDTPVVIRETGTRWPNYRDALAVARVYVAPRKRGAEFYPAFSRKTKRNAVEAVTLE